MNLLSLGVQNVPSQGIRLLLCQYSKHQEDYTNCNVGVCLSEYARRGAAPGGVVLWVVGMPWSV